MNKSTSASNVSSNKQSKGTIQITQLQTIFQYLLKHEATASMVSKETNVPQKSICRYKRDLEKRGLLIEIVKKPCKTTGFKAWYLTTDATKFQNIANNQLNLF